MSQRVPSRNRAPSIVHHQDSNFYLQDPTLPHSSNNKHVHHHHHNPSSTHHHHQPGGVRLYRNSYTSASTPQEAAMTDDTDAYYEYYNDAGAHYQNHHHHGDVAGFSEDSGSVRLPLYESEDGGGTASRNDYLAGAQARGSQGRRSQMYRDRSSAGSGTRDMRRVYPNAEGTWGRMYQEVTTPDSIPAEQSPQLRTVPVPSGYHRPQSPSSSAVGSTVVDGCGGKCQTCENVCYFFLQLVFTMGILIGVSLCIAGTVLRKSAARNLQVLVYIGAMVSMVSALLLCIQCNARKSAKNRKKALWNAKRAPIPMETLNVAHAGAALPQQQPLVVVQENRTQRVVQLPQNPVNAQRFRDFVVSPDSSLEEQGIPWWRRKEMN